MVLFIGRHLKGCEDKWLKAADLFGDDRGFSALIRRYYILESRAKRSSNDDPIQLDDYTMESLRAALSVGRNADLPWTRKEVRKSFISSCLQISTEYAPSFSHYRTIFLCTLPICFHAFSAGNSLTFSSHIASHVTYPIATTSFSVTTTFHRLVKPTSKKAISVTLTGYQASFSSKFNSYMMSEKVIDGVWKM